MRPRQRGRERELTCEGVCVCACKRAQVEGQNSVSANRAQGKVWEAKGGKSKRFFSWLWQSSSDQAGAVALEERGRKREQEQGQKGDAQENNILTNRVPDRGRGQTCFSGSKP